MYSGTLRDTQELEDMRETVTRSTILQTASEHVGSFKLACLLLYISQTCWALSFIYPNEHNFSAFETGIIRGITTVLVNYLICFYR